MALADHCEVFPEEILSGFPVGRLNRTVATAVRCFEANLFECGIPIESFLPRKEGARIHGVDGEEMLGFLCEAGSEVESETERAESVMEMEVMLKRNPTGILVAGRF